MIFLKELTIHDIGQAIRLSNAERWNQTNEDWKLLIQNPQNECLAAVADGNIIGTATAINYKNDIAWIGMVLVDREYRGRGVSKMLLSSLFERLRACRSVKLDATPAGQPVYQRFGFKDEYLVYRMTSDSVLGHELSFDDGIYPEPIQIDNIPEIIEFDKRVFGANREQLIRFLFKNDPGNAWVIRRNSKITGFVLGRNGSRFHQVGPLYASNMEDSKKLIAKSFAGLDGQSVVMDILEDKKELILWLNSLGFSIQRPFIRMYKNENPFLGVPENQFLICGPEFG